MTTRAPRPASPTAASFPIPLFPPVITTTLPTISVMTDNAIRDRTSDETLACESTCDHQIDLTALRERGAGVYEHGRVSPDREPRRHRRPAHRRAGRDQRVDRLHVVPALRIGHDLLLPARRPPRRPLPDP